MKEAFVRAVIDDVPTENYKAQGLELVQKFLITKMPTKIKAVYDDKALRNEYLLSHIHRVFDSNNARYFAHAYGPEINRDKYPEELIKKLNVLAEKYAEQAEKIKHLKLQLKGLVNSVTTRAQLVKAAPELEKYLPAEPEKTRQLPVATGVITNLVEAGWPKGGE